MDKVWWNHYFSSCAILRPIRHVLLMFLGLPTYCWALLACWGLCRINHGNYKGWWVLLQDLEESQGSKVNPNLICIMNVFCLIVATSKDPSSSDPTIWSLAKFPKFQKWAADCMANLADQQRWREHASPDFTRIHNPNLTCLWRFTEYRSSVSIIKSDKNTAGIYHKLIMAVDATLSFEETLWFQRTRDSAGNTAIGQKLKGKTHPDNFRLVG